MKNKVQLEKIVNNEYDVFIIQMQERIKRALKDEYEGLIRSGQYEEEEDIEKHCKKFKTDIDDNKKNFSNETLFYAYGLLTKLSIHYGIFLCDITTEYPFYKKILDYDSLEGHEFEYWCAELLRHNGFNNIKVTQGSGDQGVDIVAEKEEIRYAIQCKCYASDLGNTPIQEVCAGKSFYNCQIGVVMTNRFFTKSAKDLAKATGILLWDRGKMVKMIKQAVEIAYLKKTHAALSEVESLNEIINNMDI